MSGNDLEKCQITKVMESNEKCFQKYFNTVQHISVLSMSCVFLKSQMNWQALTCDGHRYDIIWSDISSMWYGQNIP